MAKTHFSGPIISASNIVNGYTSTVTAAGTTVLSESSTGKQFFTGSTTQTVKMPPTGAGTAQVLPLGYAIEVVNLSSGTVTVQDSAAGAIGTVVGSAKKAVTLTANTTAAGVWAIL